MFSIQLKREMDNFSIKNNIRRTRKEKGLTQEEMAHLLNMSLTAYRDLEKGATNMLNSNISRIAEITDSSVEEIVLSYRPLSDDKILKEFEDYKAEYGNREEALKTRIKDLEKIVASLEEIVVVKNEIINMLKKNID